jgi:WD40 repeat protein
LSGVVHDVLCMQCDKLRLALVSPPGDRAITALAATGELTITACGPRVFVWKRLELVRTIAPVARPVQSSGFMYISSVIVCLQVHTYEGHTADVKHLLVFGPHLISVADDQTLRIWDLASGESAGVIELPPQDRVTALMHPDTYLNKVIVAYASGTMELWNLRTATRIHRFAHFARPAAAAMEILLGTAPPAHATASILCVVQVCLV